MATVFVIWHYINKIKLNCQPRVATTLAHPLNQVPFYNEQFTGQKAKIKLFENGAWTGLKMSEKAEQTSKEKHLKDWKTITLTPL